MVLFLSILYVLFFFSPVCSTGDSDVSGVYSYSYLESWSLQLGFIETPQLPLFPLCWSAIKKSPQTQSIKPTEFRKREEKTVQSRTQAPYMACS